MNCQACQIEIEELETGAFLSNAARTHISVCQPCRAFHDERQSLRELMGSLEPVTAPTDFEFRLRARIASSGNGASRHFSFRSFLASVPAIALAASFALLIAGVIIYKQIKSGTATNQPTAIAKDAAQTNETSTTNPSTVTTIQKAEDGKNSSPVVAASSGKKQSLPLTAGIKNPARRQPIQSNAGNQQIVTSENAVRPAPRITPSVNAPSMLAASRPVELPVRSISQPVRVSLGDASGSKRTATLEPVVFGSQDLIGRNLSRATSSQGIW